MFLITRMQYCKQSKRFYKLCRWKKYLKFQKFTLARSILKVVGEQYLKIAVFILF